MKFIAITNEIEIYSNPDKLKDENTERYLQKL